MNNDGIPIITGIPVEEFNQTQAAIREAQGLNVSGGHVLDLTPKKDKRPTSIPEFMQYLCFKVGHPPLTQTFMLHALEAFSEAAAKATDPATWPSDFPISMEDWVATANDVHNAVVKQLEFINGKEGKSADADATRAAEPAADHPVGDDSQLGGGADPAGEGVSG